MIKKIMVILLILAIYIMIGQKTEQYDLIPKDAIRVRVIANSNSNEDQEEKYTITEKLETYLYDALKDVDNVKLAKQTISDELPNIEKIVSSNLTQNDKFNVNFGMNYFPKKEYKSINYDEGYYESLVITLGEGLGDNWWCVLFPPLCLLEGTESTDVEYRSLVKEIVDKFFE